METPKEEIEYLQQNSCEFVSPAGVGQATSTTDTGHGAMLAGTDKKTEARSPPIG